jgi:membrane protein YqaA with SNARE-associated domain
MEDNKRRVWLRVLIFILLIGITILLLLHRQAVQQLSLYGYSGIFLLSVLTNATLILPLPGVLITSAMGAVFQPFWVAMAAGAGAALGELTGYLAGYSGQIVIENRQWYRRVMVWMRRYGSLTILILAFIPNPIFDLAGIAAGGLKFPVHRFLFWCLVGKILKMMLFAYSGAGLFSLFR